MEEKLSEPDGDSLAEDFDLKENSLLLRKRQKCSHNIRPGLYCSKGRYCYPPVDSLVCFVNSYPLDSVLSGG